MKRAIITFIKNPRLGKVKTRLANDLGKHEALRIYLKLLENTRSVVEPLKAKKFLFYSDEVTHSDMWSSKIFDKHVQRGNDLGSRLQHATDLVFNKSFSKVLIIGSDCPDLSTEILQKAYRILDKKDIVIGPANDGGYYLIGMKSLHSQLFDLTEWSTATVFKETIHKIQQQELSWSELPTLIDIDTMEDFKMTNLK